MNELKSVELPKGWLMRQIEEVNESVKTLPKELLPLLTLNAELNRGIDEKRTNPNR